MRVLIVEDEPRLAHALQHIMLERRYLADVVYNGRDAVDYAMAGDYDVMILDVMLPELDGFQVAAALREAKNNTPILMLTAKDAIPDKVAGLNCGADDSMTKPFSTEELLARIGALTRRQGEVILDELRFEDLVLDLHTGELRCGSEAVRLNFKELELMRLFLSGPKRLRTKEHLIAQVWGLGAEVDDNNVEAYVSFLRRKLRFLGSRVTIKNRKKLGYTLEVAEC